MEEAWLPGEALPQSHSRWCSVSWVRRACLASPIMRLNGASWTLSLAERFQLHLPRLHTRVATSMLQSLARVGGASSRASSRCGCRRISGCEQQAISPKFILVPGISFVRAGTATDTPLRPSRVRMLSLESTRCALDYSGATATSGQGMPSIISRSKTPRSKKRLISS